MKTILIIYIAVVSNFTNEAQNWYHEIRLTTPSMEHCREQEAQISSYLVSVDNTEISISSDCFLAK